MQSNLFFLIIPLCPVFLDSKPGENIQESTRWAWYSEEGRPCSATVAPCAHHNSTRRCLSALQQSGRSHASWRGKRPRGDRRAPCCSIHRPLWVDNTALWHLTLEHSGSSSICACPPPCGPPAHLPGPLQQNILSRSRRAHSNRTNLIPEALAEPMVSDMIQQQLADLCFQEIGTRVDRISQKSLFHDDKIEGD